MKGGGANWVVVRVLEHATTLAKFVLVACKPAGRLIPVCVSLKLRAGVERFGVVGDMRSLPVRVLHMFDWWEVFPAWVMPSDEVLPFAGSPLVAEAFCHFDSDFFVGEFHGFLRNG